MAHDSDWRRELGQQLRVDGIRATAAAGSGHPTSSMSASDLMAVLLDGHLRLDYSEPGQPGERPPDLLQGSRVAAVLRDPEGRRRDRRRGAADLPQARLAAGGAPDARGSRRPTSPPARSARACRSASAWRWPAARWTSCPTACGCSAATARWPRARCGRPSSTPAGSSSTTSSRSSTSTASARRARRCSAGTSTATSAHRGLRLEGDRHRRPRRRRHRGRLRRGRGDHRPARRDRRPDQEGQGRQGGRGPARQARQAARRSRGGDRGARRRARR